MQHANEARDFTTLKIKRNAHIKSSRYHAVQTESRVYISRHFIDRRQLLSNRAFKNIMHIYYI